MVVANPESRDPAQNQVGQHEGILLESCIDALLVLCSLERFRSLCMESVSKVALRLGVLGSRSTGNQGATSAAPRLGVGAKKGQSRA